jgi:hypothetical protein
VSAVIYLEGGGDSKDLHVRCREGFRKLLAKTLPDRKMPRLVACGGRGDALARFQDKLKKACDDDFIGLLLDSEVPLTDIDAAWTHLQIFDGWIKPRDANDRQVLFMTTCMETWIVADIATLRTHYAQEFRERALLPLRNLEERSREEIQSALQRATRDCTNAYTKGKRSFTVLAELNPAVLATHLPSFARMKAILQAEL